MKKKIVILITVAVIITLSIAGFNAYNAKSVVLSNTEPMYGAASYKQYLAKRTPEMKATDDAFISDVTKYQTKEEAISALLKQAWTALSRNDFENALMKFNQVWLLDNKNFNAFWGFGAISSSQNEPILSVEYFDIALAAYSDEKMIEANDKFLLWDDAAISYLNISDVYIKENAPSKGKKYATKALGLLNDLSKQSDKLPQNIVPQVMFLTAVAHYNSGDNAGAKAAYNAAVEKFPEIRQDSNAVWLENELSGQ